MEQRNRRGIWRPPAHVFKITTLILISDASTIGESFTTNITCGGISSGTSISSSDKLNAIVKNMVYSNIDPTDPNTRYEDKSLGIWSTAAQVNTFFTNYTYAKNWTGLSVGNYVTISDGTYNKDWVIAGFNCESANDGVAGGIVFIPRYVILETSNWDNSDTGTPYMNSGIHTYINGEVKTNLSIILGSHIVQRNVTLGSSMSTSGTTASTSTTAYLTLMSWGQLSGTFASHNRAYDDGEANYKLPLFNFISISTYAVDYFWLRNAYGKFSSVNTFGAWYVTSNGDVASFFVNATNGVCPLMYLR